MSGYSFSPLAELDLIDIAEYTTDIWGPEQAVRYLDGLFACFARIVRMPELGRPCHAIRSGVRRIEEGKHVIFYQLRQHEIFICRILHQSMLPARHQILED